MPSDLPSVRRGKVPVFVMLPLDTVSRDGKLQRVDELRGRLASLKRAGVAGVMVDVWWGIVERRGPGQYDWDAYLELVGLVAALDLKLHAVLSFHSCGANRDDDYHVPLPQWVMNAVARDPDGLLFTDKAGTKSDEYLSFWADHARMPMLPPDDGSDSSGGGSDQEGGEFTARLGSPIPPRTPLNCYREMMAAFKRAFATHLGPVITEVLVGCGPCGELRYPAYAMSRGWTFPGVGEFQCYDRRALESLQAAAAAAGRPEWGAAGPHDAGHYNSHPDDTGFFANGAGVGDRFGSGGSAGDSGSRLGSMDRMGSMELDESGLGRKRPFASSRNTSRSSLDSTGRGDEWKGIDSGVGHKGSDGRIRSLENMAAVPNGRWDSEYGRFFLGWYCGELVEHGRRVMGAAAEVFAGTGARLALKCAGIHWWYRTRSHAAELTTGYYNVEEAPGQFSPHGSGSTLHATGDVADAADSRRCGGCVGCVEDSMREVSVSVNRRCAAARGYDSIMAMCKEVGASVTFTCAEMSDGEHTPFHMCGPEGLLRQVVEAGGRHGVEVAAENALYRCDAAAFSQIVRNCKGEDEGGDGGKGPAMHSFTFLRLCDSLMEDHHFTEFEAFVRNMNN